MGGSDPRAAQAGRGDDLHRQIDAVARQALPHALPTNFDTDSVARVELYIEDNPVNVILVEMEGSDLIHELRLGPACSETPLVALWQLDGRRPSHCTWGQLL